MFIASDGQNIHGLACGEQTPPHSLALAAPPARGGAVIFLMLLSQNLDAEAVAQPATAGRGNRDGTAVLQRLDPPDLETRGSQGGPERARQMRAAFAPIEA
jgi:hypothetical protein